MRPEASSIKGNARKIGLRQIYIREMPFTQRVPLHQFWKR